MRFNHFVEKGRHVATIATEPVDDKTIAYGVTVTSWSEKNPTTHKARTIASCRCKQASQIKRTVQWRRYFNTNRLMCGEAHHIIGDFEAQGINKLGIMPIDQFKVIVQRLKQIY